MNIKAKRFEAFDKGGKLIVDFVDNNYVEEDDKEMAYYAANGILIKTLTVLKESIFPSYNNDRFNNNIIGILENFGLEITIKQAPQPWPEILGPKPTPEEVAAFKAKSKEQEK